MERTVSFFCWYNISFSTNTCPTWFSVTHLTHTGTSQSLQHMSYVCVVCSTHSSLSEKARGDNWWFLVDLDFKCCRLHFSQKFSPQVLHTHSAGFAHFPQSIFSAMSAIILLCHSNISSHCFIWLKLHWGILQRESKMMNCITFF